MPWGRCGGGAAARQPRALHPGRPPCCVGLRLCCVPRSIRLEGSRMSAVGMKEQ
jgi:hypothetical protein